MVKIDWIDVKDKMPERHSKVLVYLDNENLIDSERITIARFVDNVFCPAEYQYHILCPDGLKVSKWFALD